MKLFSKILFFGVCLIATVWSLNAQSNSQKLKSAMVFYKQKKYHEAAVLYEQLETVIKFHRRDYTAAAESFSHTNKVHLAVDALKHLIDDGADDKSIWLSYARALHHSNQFMPAASAYKSYLKKLNNSDKQKPLIEQEILRCLNGAKYKRQTTLALVEPLGASVNTSNNEFGAIPSIHFSHKYYFSASRPNHSDKRTDRMYSIEEKNGSWSPIKPIGSSDMLECNETLLDFIHDGTAMVFLKSSSNLNPELLIKNFDEPEQEQAVPLELPLRLRDGDKDPFFFQDSLLFFSSNRPGGFGGYDLYLSILRDGNWLMPVNLGKEVNSPFDEISPCLAKNGFTLYYSSNNLESIGGFDIFRSNYKPESNGWSQRENLGIPINTAANEFQFRLDKNGISAVFTSDRWDLSKGGLDIFIAYFKEELEEQLDEASGSPLNMLFTENPVQPSVTSNILQTVELKKDLKQYTLEFIQSSDDDFLTNPKCIATVETLIGIMKTFPSTTVELIGHSNQSSNSMINLFTSIKKSLELNTILIQRGIASERIRLLGCGSDFLLCKPGSDGLDNKQSRNFNNRIELHVIQNPESTFRILYKEPLVPEFLQVHSAFAFQNSSSELIYSIVLGESTQMLTKEILDLEGAKKYVEATQDRFYYYLGQFREFKQVKEFIEAHKPSELPRIQAFYKGHKIDPNALINYISEYPDLILLMDYNKNWK